MIYLIDDNQGNKRIQLMNFYYIDDGSFDDILVSIDKIEMNANLQFLEKADCIIVHSTTEDCDENGNFIEGSRKNVECIIEKISDKGDNIPLVIFSNSMPEDADFDYDNNPNIIYRIKKNVFYSNFYDFLQFYRNNNKVDLRLIAYGKKYKSIEISKYFNKLTNKLLENPTSELLHLGSIDLSHLRKFHELSGIKMSFNEFVNNLEDYPITIEKFTHNLSLIVESINEYEENIYDWPE